MSNKDEWAYKLEKHIERPVKVARQRTLITLRPADYLRITGMATKLDTTPARVVAALLAYYDE